MEIIFTDEYFNILLLLNGLAILLYYGAEKKAKKRAMMFGNFETLKKVTSGRMIKSGDFSLILRLLGFSLIIIGISGPVLVEEVPSTGTDYVFAIDSSGSMTASDIEPTRLQAAKELTSEFSNQLPESSDIGLVSYSGSIDAQYDTTSDKQLFRDRVRNISLGSVAGTATGDAVITGSTLLANSEDNKTLILITDGKRNIGAEINESISYADRRNVSVNAIGIGNSNVSTENISNENLQGQQAQFPNLELNNLRALTNSTGGELSIVTDREGFETAFNSISTSEVERDISTEIILIGLIILLGEWGFNVTKYRILP